MRALITGIAGFAGSHLADFLLKQANMEVSGIELKSANFNNLKQIKKKIRIYKCDIRDYSAISRVIKDYRPNFVFHLAAQANVSDSWRKPSESLNANIIGTLNILEAIRKIKLKARIQIACSAEEYGLVYENEIPIKETNPLRPLSPYAVGKIGQDMLGYQYSQNYGMFIVRTRAFSHAGPRMSDNFMVSNFSRQVALIEKGRQKPVIHVGNLNPVRDYSDVRDVVRAYWLCLKKCKAGQVYNICSGKGKRVREILELLLTLSQKKIAIKEEKDRFRPSDIRVLVGDNSKLYQETGWKPRITLRETLKDILDYWRERV